MLNKQIEQLESEMEQLESEKKEIELHLSNPEFYQNQEKAAETGKRYQILQEEIPKLLQEWEAKQVQLEELVSSLEKLRS
jgi:ATP-binding cassette subfamily F protein 3